MIPWKPFLFSGLLLLIVGYITQVKSSPVGIKIWRLSWDDPDIGRKLKRVRAKTWIILGWITTGLGTLLLIIDTIIKYSK